jgi:hypothetical protein
MKHKYLLSFCLLLFEVGFLQAQFTVKPTFFETTGVSNQGMVVGYEGWSGPYSLWDADLNTTQVIGGLAPGNGVGGQARFSDDGNFLSGTSMGLMGPELSRYNVATQTWTPLGSLGFAVDSTVSAGFCISGDGQTVVGNTWADTTGGHAYTHGGAWSQAEGFLDLGSMHSNIWASARANAVNHDGSVVVGLQDFNGPWKSAVWRKNPAGGYFPNTYLLVDTTVSASDEFNQLGECSAISADGNWIGGHGDFANNNEPWIWSAATGVINLGTLSPGAQGYVSGINADGSVVVGRFNLGPWGPQLPFIWTPWTGLQNLNTYLNDSLGIATGTSRIYSANCMSADGRYLAGYGVDDSTFAFFTYRATLPLMVNVQPVAAPQILRCYPNPATDRITVENIGESALKVYSAEGREILATSLHGNQSVDVSAYPAGLYLIALENQASGKTMRGKFIKK